MYAWACVLVCLFVCVCVWGDIYTKFLLDSIQGRIAVASAGYDLCYLGRQRL